eukprot:674708-Pyramimonas_sp.AAC.1
MEAFDGIPREPGRCDFDAHIDDLSLNATGSAKEVIGAICRGARALHAAVTRALQCKLVMDKIGMVSSSSFVAHKLEESLGSL